MGSLSKSSRNQKALGATYEKLPKGISIFKYTAVLCWRFRIL
jgi:hypothetical protein